VHFVEHVADDAPFDPEVHLAWFNEVIGQFGLAGRASLVRGDGHEIYCSRRADLLSLAENADLLVNISGNLRWEPMLQRMRRKAYVDIDPGYTQVWHESGISQLAEHDHYFTIAHNIGQFGCTIPMAGLPWKVTRQPVVLEQWPVTTAADPGRFTTVASWRGAFGPIDIAGQRLGVKAHEFRRIITLPRQVPQRMEIALNIDSGDAADRQTLLSNGWHLADPSRVSRSPDDFRRYVQSSGGECSAVQGVYVSTKSGWFSDRTIRYLASGRPALIQDTGYGQYLPTGMGLVSFTTPDEAVAGAARIDADYAAHATAARQIAEKHFASDVVLPRFLDDLGGLR
jgi:hypothetical protein